MYGWYRAILQHRRTEVNYPFPFSSRNAKQMPTSVCDALKEVFQKEGGISESQAHEMLDAMEKTGRFQSETWS